MALVSDLCYLGVTFRGWLVCSGACLVRRRLLRDHWLDRRVRRFTLFQPPPPPLLWSVSKRKQPGGDVAAGRDAGGCCAADVGMDSASARVDEPVPPPGMSGLLDGALPMETAGGEGAAGGGGAASGGGPALDVAPVYSQMPVAEGATDPSESGSAAVPPPEATSAGPLAEATSPTAGEVGLCTLRCLLANSTEFRLSAPPETSVRDVKSQILTQQPPRTLARLRGWETPGGVVHAFFCTISCLCVLCGRGLERGLPTTSIGPARTCAHWRRHCCGGGAGGVSMGVVHGCAYVFLPRTALCSPGRPGEHCP